jgi:hypothetical protein
LAATPFVSETHPVQARQKINPMRRDAQLDDLASFQEVTAPKADFPEPKGAQANLNPLH